MLSFFAWLTAKKHCWAYADLITRIHVNQRHHQQVIYDGRLSAIQRVSWCTAGLCLGPSALHHLGLHRWSKQDCQCHQPRLPSTPVRRRLSSVRECSSRRCVIGDHSAVPVYRWRCWVVQHEPATSEPSKDTGYLAGFETAGRQSGHCRRAGHVHNGPNGSSARDLGVILDSYLMMALHVSAVCRAAYYQLRQLRPLMRSLSFDAAKLLV